MTSCACLCAVRGGRKSGLWEAKSNKEEKSPWFLQASGARNATGDQLPLGRDTKSKVLWGARLGQRQVFSELSTHQDHLEDLLKHKFQSPTQRVSDLADGGKGVQELAFLTGSKWCWLCSSWDTQSTDSPGKWKSCSQKRLFKLSGF